MQTDQCNFIINTTYLYTEVSSVNIIAQKEIAGGSGWTTNLEQFHQVVELTMHITTNYVEESKTGKVLKHSIRPLGASTAAASVPSAASAKRYY